jgi:TetR/AcrR family transcriptional regulator, transcriptional repressor for nem operon
MPAEQTRGQPPPQDTSTSDPRSRIVAAATALLLQRGVASLTREEIRDVGGVTGRDLDRLFPDLDGLVQAIVDTQLEIVLGLQLPVLRAVSSVDELYEWRTQLLERSGSGKGCLLGSLIYHLADRHDRGHRALAGSLARWQELLAAALTRIQAAGRLRQDADPAGLAVGMMAALQGGYLLSHTAKDTGPLRVALDMALNHVRSYAV